MSPNMPLTGITDNPYSSHLVEPARGGYIFNASASLDAVVELLKRHDWRGELVGPHGAGKSTLLTDISDRLNSKGLKLARWRCSDERRLPPQCWLRETRRTDVVMLDGGERLLPGLMWVLRATTRWWGKGLIITAHTRVGLGAAIPVEANAPALEEKVQQLLTACRQAESTGAGKITCPGVDEGSEGTTFTVDGAGTGNDSRGTMEDCLRQHNGNAREVLFDLYLEYEEKTSHNK